MPGMPYHLEKGPLLSVLDDFFNRGTKSRLLNAHAGLNAGRRLTDIGLFDSPNLYSPNRPWPYDREASLIEHFEKDWLGTPPISPDQTGHWQLYKGPVEDIVRQTLIRAIELVLGIPHGTAAPTKKDALRHWPIDFWWKCPQPWFEGWITWRQGAGAGKVTVIWATPSDDGVVLRRPSTEAVPAPAMVTTQTEGSWLITAEEHKQKVQITTAPTPIGTVVFPTTLTEDVGPIVALAPRFGSGGAQNGGFPYTGRR